MISYVQKKPINYKRIEKLLLISEGKGHFTNNGPVKKLLEEKLSEIMELPEDKKVLCVANGTAAFHALVMFYETKLDRKLSWISPSFTFATCITNDTNMSLCDIDRKTLTFAPGQDIEEDGIVITNLFGSKLEFNANHYTDKIIISDNASSFMSKYKGKNINLFADTSFSSLHHTKTLGFGEGGFIVLDAKDYDEVQAICGFGFKGHRIARTAASNFKMSDPMAAFILQHIEGYNFERHYELQDLFKQLIDLEDNCNLLGWHEGIFYGNLPVIFERPVDIQFFRDRGIEANKYYGPLQNDPNSNELYAHIINFPLYCDLTDAEVMHIVSAIREFE